MYLLSCSILSFYSFDDITYRQYYVLFHLEKFTSDKTDNITYYVENANAFGLPIMSVIRRTSKVPHITPDVAVPR